MSSASCAPGVMNVWPSAKCAPMFGRTALEFCLIIEFSPLGEGLVYWSGERCHACLTVSLFEGFSDRSITHRHLAVPLEESDRRHERSSVHSSQECRLRCNQSPGST